MAAAEAYLRVRLFEGRESLKQALTSSSPSLCLPAIKIAQEEFDQNDEDLLPTILDLLDHPDPLAVRKVIQLIADFAGIGAVDPLLHILRTKPNYQQEAFSALFTIAQRERLLGIKSFIRRRSNEWE